MKRLHKKIFILLLASISILTLLSCSNKKLVFDRQLAINALERVQNAQYLPDVTDNLTPKINQVKGVSQVNASVIDATGYSEIIDSIGTIENNAGLEGFADRQYYSN